MDCRSTATLTRFVTRAVIGLSLPRTVPASEPPVVAPGSGPQGRSTTGPSSRPGRGGLMAISIAAGSGGDPGEGGGAVTADWQPDSSRFQLPQLSRVRLDELLQELLDRVGDVLATQDRLHALLDAVVSIGSDLDLRSVLERIVAAACRLA